MNAHDVAAERRLDAFLGEAMSGDDAAELEARVLLRLRSVPPQQRRAKQYAAAALMLVGVAVVAAVARLRHGDALPAEAAQDPERAAVTVAVVTNAALPTPTLIDVAAGADVTQEILRICERADASVIVDGTIDSKVKRAIERAPWRETLVALAADAGAGVEEVDGILVVRAGARSLPYGVRATFGSDAILVRDFAKVVSLRCGVDLVVAEDLQGHVRCDLTAASWRDALDVAARQLGGEVVGCGGVLVLRRRSAATDAPRATFSRYDVPADAVAEMVARDCVRNVLLSPRLADVSARVHMQPAESVFGALARAVGGVYCLEDPARRIDRLMMPGPAAASSLTVLIAENVDLRTFADLLRSAADATVAVPGDCAAKLTVFAHHAPLRDLLAAAALATGRTFVDDHKRGFVIE